MYVMIYRRCQKNVANLNCYVSEEEFQFVLVGCHMIFSLYHNRDHNTVIGVIRYNAPFVKGDGHNNKCVFKTPFYHHATCPENVIM